MTTHDDLLRALADWVLDPARGADVDVPVHVGARGHTTDRWPLRDVLYELADDAEPVDDRVRAALCLPDGTRWATVARLLWLTNTSAAPARPEPALA